MQGASFTIKAHETTAIIGPPGIGKSTIVNLMERFYDPVKGHIQFDKLHLKDVELNQLRSNIGLVSQEPAFILGTIKENLLLAQKDATDSQIDNALERSRSDFVKLDLKDGIQTHSSSQEFMSLSYFQQFKLTIARAILKNPKVLIFDLDTSCFDFKDTRELNNIIKDLGEQE